MIIDYIYTISCPLSGLVIYVGKTDSPELRWKQHNYAKSKHRIGIWVRAMKSIGFNPIFTIISKNEYDCNLSEQAWLRYYLDLGQAFHNVKNKTLYLKGYMGYKNCTVEDIKARGIKLNKILC